MHQARCFSSKMQKFLRILRIYYCSNLPFNVIILYYCNLFLSISLISLFFYMTCIDSSFFVKRMQQSCIKMFKLLLLLLLLLLLAATPKRQLGKNEIPRLLANRRSSAKVLMTEPDIAHAVKEILGTRVVYVFACFHLAL